MKFGARLEEVPPVDRRRPISNDRSRSGQAMAEFLVGLVSVMLLVVGLQQISLLSDRSFAAHFNVRKSLAEQMVAPAVAYPDGFVFATKTDPGPDGKNYTADDVVVVGNDDFFEKGQGFLHAVDYAVLNGYLWDYECDDPYYRLSDSAFSELSESFDMLYATDRQSVDVVPFLRRVLGRDTIDIQQEAWMPVLDGLMR